MDLTNEDIDKLSVDDIFSLSLIMTIQKAKVDDFADGEIRQLRPKNPVVFSQMDKWDGVLDDVKELRHGDYGINKNRELFVWINEKWKRAY